MKNNIVIFDLETGGFFHKEHKYGVAEIAMIAIDNNGNELDRYEAIIAPYKNLKGELVEYTDQALAINGLTMEQIEAGKPAKVVAKEIIAFANKHKAPGRNGKVVLAGHNIEEFDIPYLSQFFDCMNIDPSKNFCTFTLDTLWWARLKFQGSLKDNKLHTVCSAFGIELVNAHRAMADVEANTKLVVKLLESLRSQGQASIQNTERPRVSFNF